MQIQTFFQREAKAFRAQTIFTSMLFHVSTSLCLVPRGRGLTTTCWSRPWPPGPGPSWKKSSKCIRKVTTTRRDRSLCVLGLLCWRALCYPPERDIEVFSNLTHVFCLSRGEHLTFTKDSTILCSISNLDSSEKWSLPLTIAEGKCQIQF